MKIGDIGIRRQLISSAILLVTLPVVILGIMSYNSAKKGISNNIEQALKMQCSDWLITTEAYYDLIQKNKRSADDRTKDIVTSQAKGVSELILTHIEKDATTVALKEPLLRARKHEKDMLLYGFTTNEFDSYVEKFNLAVQDMNKTIKEADSIGFDTKSIKIALKEYEKQMSLVKSRQRVQSTGNVVDGGVRSAGSNLEIEFSKIADKLSDERLKELLASTVIGKKGYICILDYEGNYILSKQRKMDGKNVWYAQDNQEKFFIQDIIAKGKKLEKGQIDYGNYSYSDVEGEEAKEKFIAVMPILDKQWVVGVTIYPEDLIEGNFEELKKEELKNLMAGQKIGQTGYLYIISAQGKNKGCYILSKDREKDGESILQRKDLEGNPFIEEIIKEALLLKKGGRGIKYYKWKDEQKILPRLRIMTYVYFKPWDWIIGTSVYMDEFLKDVNRIKNQIIFVCLAAIILGSALAYLFTSAMTNTFSKLVNKMGSVAKGDLEVDMEDVEVLDNKNEIGQLASAFKQMTNNLKQTTISKDYVDNIFENMNDALLVINKDFRIKTVNDAACKLLGYSESELLSTSISNFFISEAGPGSLKDIISKIFQGEVIINHEIELKDKAGNSIAVSFNGAPFKDSQGRITSVIIAVRDVRELKKARQKLEEKIIEVQKSNKELDDFTYVVSHDLKEPLRGIEAFSTFLDEKHKDKLDKDGQHYIEVIQKSVRKMQDLIKDLLELSRISRWKKPYEDVDLNKLLAEIKEGLALRLKEKNVNLKILNLPTIKYEKIRIIQLFTNLITNAIKYNDKEKPVIEVGCAESNDKESKYYVRDNGKGIAKEFQEKVFDLFQRLEGETEKGTGAGLAICKKIVEGHGGNIWIESEQGKGSTFYFTIPKQIELSKKA
ncbi:MAG: Cache 3/Cache 2 fusion domain-containing protein [Candidatus Omnitrophota bacterium]